MRRILPGEDTELFLVVDQLEEVFTLVEDQDVRERFLRSLVAAVADPAARLRVVVTLRADFYDRPLSHPGLAELMRRRSETIVPLTPEELERSIAGPADRISFRSRRLPGRRRPRCCRRWLDRLSPNGSGYACSRRPEGIPSTSKRWSGR